MNVKHASVGPPGEAQENQTNSSPASILMGEIISNIKLNFNFVLASKNWMSQHGESLDLRKLKPSFEMKCQP